MPTQNEVLGLFDSPSNWGRWGHDDEFGTLNLITDHVRLAAARPVRHDRSVSCGMGGLRAGRDGTVDELVSVRGRHAGCGEHAGGGVPPDRRWGFSNEQLGIMFHGNTDAHLDSPCHLYWDDRMYNGRSPTMADADTGSA